jgi:hypothetical protein
MRIAVELEADPDSEPPPPPPTPTEGTGPRLPFKTDRPDDAARRSSRSTAYSFTAITGERALRHVKDAYANATNDVERAEVVSLMRKLTEQGLFTEDDVAEYLATSGGKKR